MLQPSHLRLLELLWQLPILWALPALRHLLLQLLSLLLQR
jgi:hypothetical protein